MTRSIIVLPVKDGLYRRICLCHESIAGSIERYFAVVSPGWADLHLDDVKVQWVQNGNKPYGFVSEDTKAL